MTRTARLGVATLVMLAGLLAGASTTLRGQEDPGDDDGRKIFLLSANPDGTFNCKNRCGMFELCC